MSDVQVFRMTKGRMQVVETLTRDFPGQTRFTRKEIKQSLGSVPYWMSNTKRYSFKEKEKGKVVFNLSTILPESTSNVVPFKPVEETMQSVPEVMPNYVPFGHYNDLKMIVQSGMFFPVFITGLSGNGKTLMVEQICAKLKREMIRVNITIETDEDDLIGGHTLIDGNMSFREGPVLRAMRTGSVLLLDEVDLGSNKLMCLQSILEGKGYFIKKTGEFVEPKEGFTIIATANTKGQGSDDGRFIGTQIMNEAMLERFAISLEQMYPNVTAEKKILTKEMQLTGDADVEFIEKLVQWADVIRKTYNDGGIDDVITTRRLVHIVKAFRMFGDRMKSITMCVTRFDEETKNSILDLYSKIDSDVNFGYNTEIETDNEVSE